MTISKELERTGNDYGVNGHMMGYDLTPSVYTDDNLNNWSLGCQGAPVLEWFEICKLLNYSRPYQGDVLSYTLIESKDFEYDVLTAA